MISRQFTLFVLTSGLAAVVNITARWALSFTLPYDASIVLAYLCGMVTAFVLGRTFVFAGPDARYAGQALRFGLVNLVTVAQVWGVSVLLFRSLFPVWGFAWHAETVAHVIGVGSPIVTSYFAHKHFSFAKRA